MDKTIFTLFLFVATCAGFLQELTLYHGPDCTAAEMTFRTKESNLSTWEWQHFLPAVQSYRAHGWWFFYSMTGFDLPYVENSGYRVTPTCINSTVPQKTNSLRYAGPAETDTPALVAYDGRNTERTELIFTTDLAHNFGFLADYAIATGNSNWTLYYYADFSGNFTCLSGRDGPVGSEIAFRSAIKGCN